MTIITAWWHIFELKINYSDVTLIRDLRVFMTAFDSVSLTNQRSKLILVSSYFVWKVTSLVQLASRYLHKICSEMRLLSKLTIPSNRKYYFVDPLDGMHFGELESDQKCPSKSAIEIVHSRFSTYIWFWGSLKDLSSSIVYPGNQL